MASCSPRSTRATARRVPSRSSSPRTPNTRHARSRGGAVYGRRPFRGRAGTVRCESKDDRAPRGAARTAKGLVIDSSGGIYGIVDRAVTADPLALVRAMLDAGIRTIQYRAKAGVERDVLLAMLAQTRARGAVLIVNDDFEAALACDGWHAGQEDLEGRDPARLRALLGARTFGVSCGVAAEARAAEAFGADYVGVGPFAATGSKADAGAAIGAAGIRAVVAATALPVVAIGGIDATNLRDVADSGAAMAAVISAIARAPDPTSAARELVRLWGSFRN